MASLGYDDTDFIPGQPYRVHDSQRPQPTTVTPGDAPGAPPSDAVILFDGGDLSEWESAKKPGADAGWKVENGYMEVVQGTGDIRTVKQWGDCQLHVEWAAPEKVEGDSQGRGNSGVFLHSSDVNSGYEIQVLDGDKTKHGMGAVINETESPYHAYNGVGKWNSYDIVFRAARFKDGKLSEKALVSMYFNGKKVHTNVTINKVWGGANSGLDGGNKGGAGITDVPGGLKLQCEGQDVRYRNTWVKELKLEKADTDF